jgi:predicted TIM-barrel fold metal-dependent hydrolase
MVDHEPGEPIIEPDVPMVDAHHHLWLQPESYLTRLLEDESDWVRAHGRVFQQKSRYLLAEFIADLSTGHDVRATICVEAGTMYREAGPAAMRSIGEVEFATRVATATCDSSTKVCAGIVGNVDLALGEAVEDVLIAHIKAASGRYRGVRHSTPYDPHIWKTGQAHQLDDAVFRAGVRRVHDLGLSFDAFVFEPQLREITDLAMACPDGPIILNHVGMPVGVGWYARRVRERFQIWRENIQTLARCGNVVVKLGGLGMPVAGLRSSQASPRFTSQQLADEWAPYIETCIEMFGPNRCMFESNFPVDSGACSYPILWNAFKRLAAGASPSEKAALFSGTAARVYRLDAEALGLPTQNSGGR